MTKTEMIKDVIRLLQEMESWELEATPNTNHESREEAEKNDN